MENTNKEYSIERLDAGKLPDLEALHTLVYKTPPAKDHYPHKYNTSYTGVEYVGYIAYNTDRIPLAYYGVIPCLIRYQNKTLLSAQSGDTMTNPLYRYKGLFVELSTITFELCKASGIRLVFGFPNQNSYHGAVHKLGWKMTDTMERFSIPVKTLPVESLFNRFGWAKAGYRKYAKWVLNKYTLPHHGLSNQFLAEGYGGIYRDDLYLQYRTYSPTRVLAIGHALVWIRIRGGLGIGDFQVSELHFEEAMQALYKVARLLGLSQISFLVSPGTPIHALFSSKYNSEPSFPVLFQDFGSGIPLDKIKFSFSDIDIF